MKCPTCKTTMVPMILSSFCPNDCDRPKKTVYSIDGSRHQVDQPSLQQATTPRVLSKSLWLREFPTMITYYDKRRDCIVLNPNQTTFFYRDPHQNQPQRYVRWICTKGIVSYSSDRFYIKVKNNQSQPAYFTKVTQP